MSKVVATHLSQTVGQDNVPRGLANNCHTLVPQKLISVVQLMVVLLLPPKRAVGVSDNWARRVGVQEQEEQLCSKLLVVSRGIVAAVTHVATQLVASIVVQH